MGGHVQVTHRTGKTELGFCDGLRIPSSTFHLLLYSYPWPELQAHPVPPILFSLCLAVSKSEGIPDHRLGQESPKDC